MIVEKRKVDGATVLVVEGVIKLGESGRFFADALKRALSEDTGNVMVDLEKINFIDSTGIGELVGYLVRFQEQRRKLILIRPPDRVRRLLDVANVLELFPVYDDVESAVSGESAAGS
jgi:anti-sigma B factor antagonist